MKSSIRLFSEIFSGILCPRLLLHEMCFMYIVLKYDQLVASTNKWQSNKELVENVPSLLSLYTEETPQERMIPCCKRLCSLSIP